jgi:hypothetical protein
VHGWLGGWLWFNGLRPEVFGIVCGNVVIRVRYKRTNREPEQASQRREQE